MSNLRASLLFAIAVATSLATLSQTYAMPRAPLSAPDVDITPAALDRKLENLLGRKLAADEKARVIEAFSQEAGAEPQLLMASAGQPSESIEFRTVACGVLEMGFVVAGGGGGVCLDSAGEAYFITPTSSALVDFFNDSYKDMGAGLTGSVFFGAFRAPGGDFDGSYSLYGIRGAWGLLGGGLLYGESDVNQYGLVVNSGKTYTKQLYLAGWSMGFLGQIDGKLEVSHLY